MRRFSAILCIGAVVLVVAQSSARESGSGKTLKGWGKTTDPDGDCTFSLEGDRLTIEVPGTLHDLNPMGKFNAPRVLRSVSGDFVASVKVDGKVQPSGDATSGYALPYNGAGLVVWKNEQNYIRLERAAILRQGQVVSYVNFEGFEAGQRLKGLNASIPDAPAFFRIERQRGRIRASISPDGNRWSPLPEMVVKFDAELSVGVAAVNTSSAVFKAEFEGLAVSSGAADRSKRAAKK
jgi:regulation of enolase protein 1 (concanavalin A-like superfamily)